MEESWINRVDAGKGYGEFGISTPHRSVHGDDVDVSATSLLVLGGRYGKRE